MQAGLQQLLALLAIQTIPLGPLHPLREAIDVALLFARLRTGWWAQRCLQTRR